MRSKFILTKSRNNDNNFFYEFYVFSSNNKITVYQISQRSDRIYFARFILYNLFDTIHPIQLILHNLIVVLSLDSYFETVVTKDPQFVDQSEI